MMSRDAYALAKIKEEIQSDPRGRGYSGKQASHQAILMNEEISKSPKQFRNVKVDKRELIVRKVYTLTDAQVDDILTYFKLRGYSTASDEDDQRIEVKTRRSDDLSLGEILQGDVEQALR